NTEEINFNYEFRSLQEAQKELDEGGRFSAVLHIPKVVITHPRTVQIFYKDKPKGSSISYMETQIAKVIENKKLEDLHNLSLDQISGLRPNVQIVPNKLTGNGQSEETADGVASLLGFVLAFFIYFFIFLFGVQVMRGVIEEKSSRIIEVIISSVKPFQLMMGKIIGIALVALTQLLIWIVLSTVIIGGAQQFFKEELNKAQTEQIKKIESVNPDAEKFTANENQQAEFISRLSGQLSMINFPLVLGGFLFYFIGGYLLYGSLFAAIGAAADNETDTQQFMLPVTIPLILAIVMAQVAIENPDGALAFWGSIIPLTSPIIMMIRIPVGVPYWEIMLSMGLLIATFIGSTWMAGKIYRTGILMYGKKVNFKEVAKWLFHKS
ncbi:MAG: ABC transporter permease, partial [Vicingaceae bacterium]